MRSALIEEKRRQGIANIPHKAKSWINAVLDSRLGLKREPMDPVLGPLFAEGTSACA